MREAKEISVLSGRQSPFYALTFRNYRLFFIGQIISVVGTWMQTVAQQWFVWDLTHSARWLGIVSGASAIPVIFTLWGGQLADRYSRRAILVWTQVAAMLLAFVLAFIATGRWIAPQAWHVAALSAILSLVNAFNMPAQQAFVTDMVEERDALGNAIALNSMRFNLARFLGPVLAGIALVRWGAATCFALNGLSYLAVIFSLLMMRLPPFRRREQHLPVWEGFRYIGEDKTVFRTVALIGAAAILVWPVSTLYPVFADSFAKVRLGMSGGTISPDHLKHAGASLLSWMMAVSGIGAALGGLGLAVFGSRFPRRRLIYGGATAFCGSLLLLSVAPTYGLALLCLFLGGFSMITCAISANTKVQEDVPDALRGRVMAVYSLVFNGLFPVGGLAIGFLAQRLSAPLAVRTNAVLGLLVTLSLLAWSLADRRDAVRRLDETDLLEEVELSPAAVLEGTETRS